jgi:5-methylcytosine-specific restriction endonuclease McrA
MSAQLLTIARTDTTFALTTLPGRGAVPDRPAWRGKCFYCGTPIWLEADGRPITDVSVEHIEPRAHGGDDDPRNLALSCTRCNQQKGRRVDARAKRDARAAEVIAEARARRAARWRDPV